MRILEICTVPMDGNGISLFLMRILAAMPREGLDIDIACFAPPMPTIAQEMARLGCRFVALPPRNRNPIAYAWALTRHIRREQYAVAHVHGNSATMAIELWSAKLAGTKKRIAHCHNSSCAYARLDAILRPLLYAAQTTAIGCSTAAGEWLWHGREYHVLKNGVDTDTMSYSLRERIRLRKELGIEQCFAVGMTAGFVSAKNHAFLLRAFARAASQRQNLVLVLAGTGILLDDMKHLAAELGIENRVLFVGMRNDMPALLSAMDAAALPSLHEGLPAAALEAQSVGLPILLSDAITAEAAPTDLARFLPLDESAWADALANLEAVGRVSSAQNAQMMLRAKGYVLKQVGMTLREYYFA